MNCASCGDTIDPAQAFHSGAGMVCATCHLSAEQASQDAAAADQARSSSLGDALDGSFSKSETRTEVGPDGKVRTTTTTTTVDLGPIGVIVKGVMSLFGR
jgi:hypothetical protein